MNAKKLFITLAAGAAIVFATLFLLELAPQARGKVEIPLRLRQDQISPVQIEVQMVGGPENGSYEMYLFNIVEDTFRRRGIQQSFRDDARYVLICSRAIGFCLPYFGRELSSLNFNAIRTAEFELKERATGTVVAKASFSRWILGARPDDWVFQELLREMLSQPPTPDSPPKP
jgi:hypothetical protein